MLRIATTVGTSLLENFRETGGPAFNNFMKRIEERPAADYNSFKAEIEQHLKSLSEFIKKDPGVACAEINSCNLIIKKYNHNTIIFLISTDTLSSVIAAEAIASYLQSPETDISTKFERTSELHVIPGLQVQDKADFESKGLQNLMGSLHNFLVKEVDVKKPGYRAINITGGFKGVIPYMTIFAQLKNLPIFYAFESTGSLIEIPPLPIGFESAFAEKYGYMLNNKKIIGVEGKQELVDSGLLNHLHQPTSLAGLLTEYDSDHQPTSINILGLVIEYKLMEYYTTNSYTGYPNVERGNLWLAGTKMKHPPMGAEIDILLKKSKKEIDATPFIAIECKSARLLSTKLDKITRQLQSKLSLMKKKMVAPDEIHFVFYFFPEKDLHIQKAIHYINKSQLKVLERTVHEIMPEKTVRFFLAIFDLKRVYVADNPYQSFVNEKLVMNQNFKEIILESKNV